MTGLEILSKKKLYELASEKGIRGRSKMSREQLASHLASASQPQPQPQPPLPSLPPNILEHIVNKTNKDDMALAITLRSVSKYHHEAATSTHKRFVIAFINLVTNVLFGKHDEYMSTKHELMLNILKMKRQSFPEMDFGIKFEVEYVNNIGKNISLSLSNQSLYSLKKEGTSLKMTRSSKPTPINVLSNYGTYDNFIVRDNNKLNDANPVIKAIRDEITKFFNNVQFPIKKENSFKAGFRYIGFIHKEGGVTRANEELASILKNFHAIH
jgi:hypothetical protein